MRKRIVVLLLLMGGLLTLTGCNTFEGFGKDMEAVGQAIQDAAD